MALSEAKCTNRGVNIKVDHYNIRGGVIMNLIGVKLMGFIWGLFL